MPVFEMPMEKLREYTGCSPRPSDFDRYWAQALAEGQATGLEYTMTPAAFQAPGVECFDLWFIGVRGAKIHCLFLRPVEVKGKLPGVAVFHGYMHHGGEWFERLPYVYRGMAVLVMECRGQGGLSEDVYSGAGPTAFGHVVRGVRDEDPHKLYYRDVYLDAAQTVRILMSMEFVDENRVAVTGKSQGGGLALAAAALVPAVKLCAPMYPFLCDFQRVLDMDLSKGAYEGFYWLFKKCDPTHRFHDQYMERLGYIDIQNHTPNVKAKVLWQTGLMDDQCPPSAQFAAYNKLRTEKRMILYPDHTHELIYFANDEIFKFFLEI